MDSAGASGRLRALCSQDGLKTKGVIYGYTFSLHDCFMLKTWRYHGVPPNRANRAVADHCQRLVDRQVLRVAWNCRQS